MQDLTPVGLTEDGTCLLLVTASGEKFLLPVDDQVQRLVGGVRRPASPPDPAEPTRTAPSSAPPLGSPPRRQEHTMDSALRPRDIQARIRAGESAETVAAAAGTSVEAVMPYASPVLAERTHQAQVALRASVRRSSGSGAASSARTLGDAVDRFLSAHGLPQDAVTWDSWRRPDGRWALTAQVEAAGRLHDAAFVHDVAGRYVVAENDDAQALTEGSPAPGTTGTSARRLSAVSDRPAPRLDPAHPDSLGEDAIALVRDRREEPTVLDRPPRDVADEPTVEVGADPADAALDDADDTDDVLGDADAAPHEADEPDASASEAAPEQPAQPQPDDHEQPALDLGVEEQEATPATEKGRRGRKGRASVPSWDEIMFGGGAGGAADPPRRPEE